MPEHFSWMEMACWDRRGPRWKLLASYPLDWREGRGAVLRAELEAVRHELGDAPLILRSCYRTPEYNALVGGRRGSYHVRGMAADIGQRDGLTWEEFQAGIRRAAQRDGSAIHYILWYPQQRFAHIDIRERDELLEETT